jgi:hypothetical protein
MLHGDDPRHLDDPRLRCGVADLGRSRPAHVFPQADHNLFITESDPEVPLAGQLAPGFLDMLTAWLAAS